MSGERAWPRRAPWLRVALFAGFLASLPLAWTEEIPSGCGAGQPGVPVVESGWQLLSQEPQAVVILGVLLVGALVLALLARKAHTGVRLAAHVVATLAGALLFSLAHFAATFTLFARIRILPGGWLGLGCLALATLDALARAIGELVQLVRERRQRPRG